MSAPGAHPAAEPAPLLGQAELRGRLSRLLTHDRLHPCLLFVGPPGIGKRGLARWLAMHRNCDAPGAPCGVCWSCRQIERGLHPDVLELIPDPEKATPIISVAQARELMGQLSLHRSHARTRFVLIDEVDRLTAEAANALLLTLEEPPDGTMFVLMTGRPSALLSTVRSRCQRVNLRPVPAAELSGWLSDRGQADADWLAGMAEGCPGRALRLAEGEAQRWRAVRDELLEAISGEIWAFFGLAERVAKGEKADKARLAGEQAVVLDVLERLLQDALAHHAGRPARYHADRPEVVAAWAGALGLQGVARMAVELDLARQMLAEHVNARLVFDALILRLAAELGGARRAATAPRPGPAAPGGPDARRF